MTKERQHQLKIVANLLYLLGKNCQGLFFHPYQTVQALVREKIFIWLVLLPIYLLGPLTVLWKLLKLLLASQLGICSGSPMFCGAINFVALIITFYCLYWQILLLYLLFRFTIGFRK